MASSCDPQPVGFAASVRLWAGFNGRPGLQTKATFFGAQGGIAPLLFGSRMAKLRISANRYIDSDDIADVEYSPPHRVRIPAVPKSHLSIELKSGDFITLDGDDADRVWRDCQNLFEF